MRKILTTALIALILLAVGMSSMAIQANPKYAYTLEEPKMKLSEFQNVNAVSGLTLKADRATYPMSNVNPVFTLTNATKQEYAYSVVYAIEKRIGGKWYTLPSDPFMAYITLAILSKPNSADALTGVELADGYQHYGQLTPGTYRFVKALNGGATVAAEFDVTADNATVYATKALIAQKSASASAAKAFELKKQEAVKLAGIQGEWAEIDKSGARGFVQTKYLAKNDGYFYLDDQFIKLIPQKYLSSVRTYPAGAKAGTQGYSVYHAGLRADAKEDFVFDQEKVVVGLYQYMDQRNYVSISVNMYVAVDEARAHALKRQLEAFPADEQITLNKWYIYKNTIIRVNEITPDASLQYKLYKQMIKGLHKIAKQIHISTSNATAPPIQTSN